MSLLPPGGLSLAATRIQLAAASASPRSRGEVIGAKQNRQRVKPGRIRRDSPRLRLPAPAKCGYHAAQPAGFRNPGPGIEIETTQSKE